VVVDAVLDCGHRRAICGSGEKSSPAFENNQF
jgi:hypothetical protein